MAYEPKTWERGEVISADALNHIEQGIAEAGGGGAEPLIIKATRIVSTASAVEIETDTPYSQAKEAFQSGIPCYVAFNPNGMESVPEGTYDSPSMMAEANNCMNPLLYFTQLPTFIALNNNRTAVACSFGKPADESSNLNYKIFKS